MSNGIHMDHSQTDAAPSGWAERVFAHPRAILWSGVTLLVLCGWTYMALMVADMVSRTDMAEAGPGMSVFNYFSDWAELGDLGRELIRSICGPIQGLASGKGWTVTDASLVFAMWTAMTLAMMVPTAAPMITAYAEIGQTARRKGITIVPTAVLIAGYLAAWLVFCAVATLAQWGLSQASLMTPGLVLASTALAGGLLILAGLYQFSSFKVMCLTKCRTPLPFFMANWSDRVTGVFRMGAYQGVVCVMCCWALMLVMFAVGLMNVIWMAVLAVIMAMEKILPNPKLLVRSTGAALILAGTALIITQ